jgi:hypothetical protein
MLASQFHKRRGPSESVPQALDQETGWSFQKDMVA